MTTAFEVNIDDTLTQLAQEPAAEQPGTYALTVSALVALSGEIRALRDRVARLEGLAAAAQRARAGAKAGAAQKTAAEKPAVRRRAARQTGAA